MSYHRGDFVTLTIGTWTTVAMIGIASPNNQSLAVLFDGAAPVGDLYALGFLALQQEADGTYVDLVTRTPVGVAPRE